MTGLLKRENKILAQMCFFSSFFRQIDCVNFHLDLITFNCITNIGTKSLQYENLKCTDWRRLLAKKMNILKLLFSEYLCILSLSLCIRESADREECFNSTMATSFLHTIDTHENMFSNELFVQKT
jgi:hypothetical protein